MGLVAALQPGDPREIGPYRILGRQGSGGMGHVFLGMSAGGRPIAVKVIREELADDPQFRVRFRREVAAARKVCGLFTAFVVDADLDGPMPWLATAYVPGPSLTEAVHEHGPLDAPTLLALAAGLAEGLNAIHAAGVVHRDMKPSNVLLAEDGPRVIDFGISGAAEASAQTGASVVIGSPGFMSPEQVLGLEIGPPSDMFSLGAVLTFAGTGHGPFGGGSNAALLYRLVNSPANLGQLPDGIRSLVGSCLAKHPSDRPTARELLMEVGALQPAPGWLPEEVIYGSTEDQAAADLTDSATAGSLISAAALAAAEPQPPSVAAARHARRRLSRPLTSALITGGLVAASAAAAFALTGGAPQPLDPQAQSQAGGAQALPGSSHVSLTPSPLSSGRPAAPAPNAYLTPALSEFLTTSQGTKVLPAKSRAPGKAGQPGKAAKPGTSPAPATSSSTPATASPSPSVTGSTSPSPSPSVTDSTSPSPSPSVTDSTSPSPAPPDTGTAAPPDTTAPSSSSS